MDKTNKTISKYYKILADVYQSRMACIDCRFQYCTQNCYKNKEYCADRIYVIMDRLLKQ